MVEGRGEYGLSNVVGARRNARLRVPRGLCDPKAMPTGSTGQHGAHGAKAEPLGPPFAPETEPAPRGRATDTGCVYFAPMPERKSSVKPGKECLLWNPRSS
jgi:hypothetical protein